MAERRTYLLIAFISLSFSSYSQNWGDYFKWTDADSLHIHPSGSEKSKKINSKLVRHTGLDTIYSSSTFYGTQSFAWSDSVYGFIVRVENYEPNQPLVILVLADKKSNLMHILELAFYTSLAGTMEETQNAWIWDKDKDGDLDIAIMNDLVDFELPLENAPNISKVDGYIYQNIEGKFVYEYITNELYQHLRVTN